MAMSRWSFVHEGHAFRFDLVTQLFVEEYVWHADVWCDQEEVGHTSGRIFRDTVRAADWTASVLKEMAACDVQESIKRRLGVDW